MVQYATIQMSMQMNEMKSRQKRNDTNEAQMGSKVHLFESQSVLLHASVCVRHTEPYINGTLFNKHQMQGAEAILNMEYVECLKFP